MKPQKVIVPPPASVLLPAWAQPETRPAELIVRAWGENKPEAARAILELCEKPASALVNIEVTPPFRMLLPGTHYDGDHPLVRDLKATGCRFEVVNHPWVCPEEEDSKHFCSPRCSVMELTETLRP